MCSCQSVAMGPTAQARPGTGPPIAGFGRISKLRVGRWLLAVEVM